MADFGLRMSFKAVKGKFLKPQAIISARDKQATRRLARVGALTRTISRRSMRPGGRRAKVSQFSPELKRLIGKLRDTKGRFRSSGEYDIKPWPIIGSDPGVPPRARTRELKDRIYFVASLKTRSVVTGPTVTHTGGVPRVLEFGGETKTQRREWVSFWSGGKRKIRLSRKTAGRIRLKPRPYMGPAHDKAIDRLIPGIWKDSIR